jgi:site-specific DNA-methyltransferase (adenine-specific)
MENTTPAGVVLCGDALKILPTLDPQSVDCCITDPPYGETSLDWDRAVNWLDLVRPLLKPHGSVWFFTSLRHLLGVKLDGWNVAQEIVWEKHNGSNFHRDRFRRVHELAVQLYPEGVKWADVYKAPVFTNDATRRRIHRKKRPAHLGRIDDGVYEAIEGGPRLARSVMRVRSCHGHAEHPTQKPEEIVRPLISYSCPKGGTVLDPFAGSGTTGAVAAAEGCGSVLIEKKPEYAAIARRRAGGKE